MAGKPKLAAAVDVDWRKRRRFMVSDRNELTDGVYQAWANECPQWSIELCFGVYSPILSGGFCRSDLFSEKSRG
jgi:hypothetical protein